MQFKTSTAISELSELANQLPSQVIGMEVQLDLIHTDPGLLVKQIEQCYKALDPNNSNLWYQYTMGHEFISNNPALLRATGCCSEWQYMQKCSAMLDIPVTKLKEMTERYHIYKNYEPIMICYDLRAHEKGSKIFAPGMYEKLGLLDMAFKIKRNRLGLYFSESDLFKHFIEDDLRSFKEYIDPTIVRDEVNRDGIKKIKAKIRNKSRGHEEVHLLCLPENDPDLKDQVNEILERVYEEANYE